ncbi:MAG: hypothetical protein AAB570_02940 [Patescibacteria group bacterium]
MKNRFKVILIVVGVVIVGLIAWDWASDGELFSTPKYPGFVNEETLDLPAEVRAQWEAQYDTALSSLEYDPEDLSANVTLAVLELSLGRYADARERMEFVLSRNQLNAVNWTVFGDVALKMGDYEAAELAYLKSLEISVDQQVIFKLEQVWREHLPSQTDNIEALYRDAIAAEGQKRFYLVQLAAWYEERDRLDEAASHLKVASDLEPDNEELKAAYEEMARKAWGL